MITPLTYYGGKQRIAGWIVENLPAHELYCEPFIGGGAVFWEKPEKRIMVINDKIEANVRSFPFSNA